MAEDEFALIKRYFRQAQTAGKGVELGIGDDCALLKVPSENLLAVSMDTLVAGVHFFESADPGLIAERALRVNLSDLAAMGAEPLWFTLALTLPEAKPEWLQGFSDGLRRVADEFGLSLVGGDTTRGPLSITIQVHGSVASNKAIRRSGAKVGDRVYVSGCLGDGAASLALLKDELDVTESDKQYLLAHYYQPRPQLREGLLLAGLATAALDVSDGLLADLGHICEESGVAAVLHVERLPISNVVSTAVSQQQAIEWALTGGDDYKLCFTVSENRIAEFESMVAKHELNVFYVGDVVLKDEHHPLGALPVACLLQGEPLNLDHKGFNHFD